MSWTHRVIRHKNDNFGGSGDWLAIHEVFMDKNGKVWGTTEEPECISGDEEGGVDGLRQCLGWMLESLDRPILNLDDIPEEGAINPLDNIKEEDLREWV